MTVDEWLATYSLGHGRWPVELDFKRNMYADTMPFIYLVARIDGDEVASEVMRALWKHSRPSYYEVKDGKLWYRRGYDPGRKTKMRKIRGRWFEEVDGEMYTEEYWRKHGQIDT